jgi:hypothetical protein
MTRQFEMNDGQLIPLYRHAISEPIWNRLEIFQERIKALYLIKQDGKYGIKSLGNEIRHDSIINELFQDNTNGCILVKSTRNRSETEKLFINTIEKCISEKIDEVYYIMLSPELNQKSRIFDTSSIVISHWKETLSRIDKIFDMKFKFQFYFIEIDSLPGCHFEHHPIKPEFSRIILTDHV